MRKLLFCYENGDSIFLRKPCYRLPNRMALRHPVGSSAFHLGTPGQVIIVNVECNVLYVQTMTVPRRG